MMFSHMPLPRREILAYNGFHHSVEIINADDWQRGHYSWIERWAYVKDLYNDR